MLLVGRSVWHFGSFGKLEQRHIVKQDNYFLRHGVEEVTCGQAGQLFVDLILCRLPSTFTFLTTLGDSSTSLYNVLGDFVDHRACLCSQPRSGTGRLISTTCSGTTLTAEHVHIFNHAQGLDSRSLWCSSTTSQRLFFLVTYELDSYKTNGQISFFRPCYKAHTSPSNKLRDYISMMDLSIIISLWTFLF